VILGNGKTNIFGTLQSTLLETFILEYQLLEVLEMERWVSGYYFESLKWVFCASYTLSFNWKPFGPLLIATIG